MEQALSSDIPKLSNSELKNTLADSDVSCIQKVQNASSTGRFQGNKLENFTK